jgi:hypothetical protein
MARPLRLLMVVLVGLWPLAAGVTPAAAQACGAANQRPCTFLERFPSCNAGLVEDFVRNRCVRPATPAPPAAALACGAANQRPCTLLERFPSCNPGLVENFLAGVCQAPPPPPDCGGAGARPCGVLERLPPCDPGLVADLLLGQCLPDAGPTAIEALRAAAVVEAEGARALITQATAFLGELAGDTAAALAVRTAFAAEDWPAAAAATRAVPGYEAMAASARADGHSTFTLGVYADGQIVAGVSREYGIAFSLSDDGPPRVFRTESISIGVALGVDVGFNLGFYGVPNNALAGDWHGVLIAGHYYGGADLGFWFTYDGNAYRGLTVAGSAGFSVEAEYNRVRTTLY